METNTHTKQYEREAYELGVEHAKNAASWVIDGNTQPESIILTLSLFDDGDPMVYDYLPRCPDLSGEWADNYTPARLADEIFGDTDDLPGEVDALADAYEAGVSDTFAPECERILREAIA